MNTDRFQFRVFAPLIQTYSYFNLTELIKVNTDYVIQQCIGIKDKNNRLIYEGDVVVYKPSRLTNNILQVAIGEYRYCFDKFSIFQLQIGKYNSYFKGKPQLFSFYDDQDGSKEFNYDELEVIGSIADKYLINKDGEVIKELEETDKTNLLHLLKYE